MMTRDETNGMLRALEAQIRGAQALLNVIVREGSLEDKADDILRVESVKLINVEREVNIARGWNPTTWDRS